MKKVCFFIIFSLCAASLPLPALADSIKLKNDGTLNGVIKGEDETSITIAIGVGTMKIRKSEIESIQKASAKENDAMESGFRKKGIERGTFVPPGMEDLAQKLKEVSGGRKSVDNARHRMDSLKEETDADSKKFKSLRADFEAKNNEIHRMDPKSDVPRYNKLITELNMINIKLSALSEELNKLNPRLPEYQRDYWKAITDYGNDIGDFRLYLEKQAAAAKKRGMTDDESLYLETVRKSLAELEKGLIKDTVAISKSKYGMTVKATLNGEVTCLLAVDTGASVVVISKEIAGRLEINPNDSVEDVQLTLADGSLIKSKVIKIKSVKVGNSTVYDVAAAVTDRSPGPEVDGLLGMSFLNNFNIKIDVANENLILETIK